MKTIPTRLPFVSIMIAALNEEKNIKKVVSECILLKQIRSEILVIIDSKTSDRTKEVAEKAGAKVIHVGKWKGKGAALRMAQNYIKGDYVVQIDADYQFLPRDIPKFIDKLLNGYDVALGSRYEKGAKVEKGSVTRFREFGIHILSLIMSIVCSQRISDMPAGFKAFKTEVLKHINIQIDHYGYEAEEIIKAAKKGYRIINVPISYKKRVEGNSKLVPIIDGLKFLGTILKVTFS